jgi:type I restriction enzyme S subunit
VLSGIDAGVSPKALDRPARAHELGVLKVSAVTWNEFRPYENKALPNDFDATNCPRVSRGDLLLSRANTAELLAAPVIAGDDYPNLLLSDKTLRLVPKREAGHAPYLLHVLRTRAARRYFESHATGTSGSMRNVSQATICGCPIPLPPLEEQQRIAAILDRAESLRAKRRRALAQLDSLTQSLFLDLFGDPVENPKQWDSTLTLGQVADIVSGVTKGRKVNGQKTREVPYLAVVNVQDRALNLAVVKTIEATEDEIARYSLKADDLLLTEGGDPDKLERGTLWQGELSECIHQNHVFRVRLTSNLVHPLFLNWLVGSQRGKGYFLRSAKQTTGIASINMTQLRGFPLLLPPLPLQSEFAAQVSAVEWLKASQRASLAKLDTLFASLQHRAFRGEL